MQLKRVLMLAAENGAMKGAKVGGMADVIRDLPPALISNQVVADVVMPGYAHVLSQVNAEELQRLSVPFAGNDEEVVLYRLPHPEVAQANIYLFGHELFHSESDQIYSDSNDHRPFADDANKFALFCLAAAMAVEQQFFGHIDVLHLHDWHTGLLAMLRRFDKRFTRLANIPCVHSIHNLALQGIRPINQDSSSLESWYPELTAKLSHEDYRAINDPRYPHCINPMRMGIVLSDKVHLVSPGYVDEVLKPSSPENGFFGGEGMEHELAYKAETGDLVGILNGCNYPDKPVKTVAQPHQLLLQQSQQTLLTWMSHQQQIQSVDYIASQRVLALQQQAQQTIDFLLTSVGRLTDQKVLILRQTLPSGQSVLAAILDKLQQHYANGVFVMIGSGDAHIADEFRRVAGQYSNFIFLNGYDEQVGNSLYRHGDLFLMPSSFEPCGISQLLAMREGQPCLVHGVGGLKNTVEDNASGFVFYGDNLELQAQALLSRLDDALVLSKKATAWKKIKASAKSQRFEWQHSAQQYIQQLYQFSN
ncbi:glycogen/starch synthase [Alteromonadaceae bacterium BrNp21-10]|nr:glycogen/starch synthase [Alteromonadaceae bacterium BrNp21-10]